MKVQKLISIAAPTYHRSPLNHAQPAPAQLSATVKYADRSFLTTRPSEQTITAANFLQMLGFSFGLALLSLASIGTEPSHAISPSSDQRTEESEKCEWLGVCDESNSSSLEKQRTTESEECEWLGVCE